MNIFNYCKFMININKIVYLLSHFFIVIKMLEKTLAILYRFFLIKRIFIKKLNFIKFWKFFEKKLNKFFI